MRALTLTLTVLTLLCGAVLAIDYRVNGEGGPAGLEDAVAAAFSSWQSVEGASVQADVTEEATNVVRYGGGDDFGPETYSLTIQRTDEAGARRVVVLLNPTLEPQNDLRRRALLHETGVLLGLSASENEGVMNPVVPAGAAAALSEADREAIRNLETFEAEDINRDGVVDFYDLADFAASFGESGVGIEADINNDGVVDEADTALLRGAYVFGAPAETPPEGITGGGTGGAGDFEGDLDDEDSADVDLENSATGGSGTGGTITGGTATGGEATGGAFEEDDADDD